jgi:hypothetical protein
MAKWPVSRWAQGAIAFAIAFSIAICVFFWANHAYVEQGIRESSPYDGQIGLSAFWGAAHLSVVTLFWVFVGLFFLMRLITAVASERSGSPP